MNSSKQGIPTDGSFWHEYSCYSMSSIGREESDVGGKIYLPAGSLSEIMSGNDRYSFMNESGRGAPMIFEISSKNGRRSYCGVMEFIAPEDTVMVPSWMMDHLELTPGQKVQIRKVILPKGIFVKLQPHSGEYKNLDLKATLEWVLRRFVALSVGDTIQLEHDHVVLKFNVLECTPDRAIAITDQDVCVDFVEPLDGSETTSAVDEDTGKKPKVPLSWSQEIAAEEEKENKKNNQDHVTVGQMDVLKGVEGVDYKVCTNCQQRVPPQGIAMHELRCQRINWYCAICNVVVLKTDRDVHNEKLHTSYICEGCGEEMEKRLILEHKKSKCPGRNDFCRFCKLKMQHRKLWEHEQNCGAQTEKCSKCKTRYSRRDIEVHESSCTGKPEYMPYSPRREKATIAPEYYKPEYKPYSPRREKVANNNNDLMLCEKCKEPFPNFEDLQVHILTMHMDELGEFTGFFGNDVGAEQNGKSEKHETGNKKEIQIPNSDNTETEKVEKEVKEEIEEIEEKEEKVEKEVKEEIEVIEEKVEKVEEEIEGKSVNSIIFSNETQSTDPITIPKDTSGLINNTPHN